MARSDIAGGAFAVTPNDGTIFKFPTYGLYVGVAGNVAVVLQDGSAVTFVGVAAGTVLPIQVTVVKATGTTATNIVALVQ